MPDYPRPVPFKSDTLFLVCKACGKRGGVPRELKGRKLADELRKLGRHGDEKQRVLLTSCQGLCPKGAAALGVVRREGQPLLFIIRSLAELARLPARAPADLTPADALA